jgi:DNA-binding GntR family transcriptional regulator
MGLSTDTMPTVADGDPAGWDGPNPRVPESYRDQVARELRRRIADGRITDRLPPEQELAAELKVSRWTLRESLTVLKAEGLIVTVARRGTFVARPEDRPRP